MDSFARVQNKTSQPPLLYHRVKCVRLEGLPPLLSYLLHRASNLLASVINSKPVTSLILDGCSSTHRLCRSSSLSERDSKAFT